MRLSVYYEAVCLVKVLVIIITTIRIVHLLFVLPLRRLLCHQILSLSRLKGRQIVESLFDIIPHRAKVSFTKYD